MTTTLGKPSQPQVGGVSASGAGGGGLWGDHIAVPHYARGRRIAVKIHNSQPGS